MSDGHRERESDECVQGVEAVEAEARDLVEFGISVTGNPSQYQA